MRTVYYCYSIIFLGAPGPRLYRKMLKFNEFRTFNDDKSIKRKN